MVHDMVHDRASPFIPEADLLKPLQRPERVAIIAGNKQYPVHSLSFEDEGLLRIGLDRISMDYKVGLTAVLSMRHLANTLSQWMGNLSDSAANRQHGERVVRLYRSWTGSLIYEVRYRPHESGTHLQMCEFAVENKKNVYQRLGTVEEEIEDYKSLVTMILGTSRCLIGIEGAGVRTPFLHSPGFSVRVQPITRRMKSPVRAVVKNQHFDISYITDHHIRLLRTGLGKAPQAHKVRPRRFQAELC